MKNGRKKINRFFLPAIYLIWLNLLLSGAVKEKYSVLISPAKILPGTSVRVIIASDEQLSEKHLEAKGEGPDGREIKINLIKSGGGPPFWKWWQMEAPLAGQFQLKIYLNREPVFIKSIEVSQKPSANPETNVFWKADKSWTASEERLYSAWLEALFQEATEKDSWPNLNSILSDPRHNFLYNHLGLSEDSSHLILQPDCADLPFFLRGYYAWKNRLPFGFHQCSRGSLDKPPSCERWLTNELLTGEGYEVRKFARLMALVMDTVHSGTARTKLTSESSDYYPLPLSRNQLRPGTVYADPYGHTLVLVRWVPQTDKKPGTLLAVDAQPDGTIGLKKFWEGNFVFVTESVVGEPGFKAFRPIVVERNQLRLLSNQEIQNSKDYGNFSLEQKNISPEAFYDRMEQLINPEPLDPEVALEELFQALYEQLLVRVGSVEMGEKFLKEHPGYVIPMPSGASVFLAGGAWENYSTPNRDLRLLMAIDTIEKFPEKVRRRPQRFRIKKSESLDQLKVQLENLSLKIAGQLSITYTRSDGSPWTLTLKEILARKEALEMAYNPNDCVEIRWGAPPNSKEISTCHRRAPQNQRAEMERLRSWFKKRLHPPT